MVNVKNDLSGKKFGRLRVLKQIEDYISPGNSHFDRWLCECECGNKANVLGTRLRNRQTQSCGCLVNNNSKYQSRVGATNINCQGLLMKLIEYNNYNDIKVKFEDGTIQNARYDTFKNGQIKNKMYPSVYGVGIIGNGIISINGKSTKEYRMWNSMLQRCYSDLEKSKKPTYKNVTCCKEWLYYPNFINWINQQQNYFNNKNSNIEWHLDKDILVKNNTIYSPDTCCIVTKKVNSMFTLNSRNGLPLGVSKYGNKYISRCTDLNFKEVQLGTFDTIEDAFNSYKLMREKLIKFVAEEEYSNGLITEKCYKAMLNYQVNIDDR